MSKIEAFIKWLTAQVRSIYVWGGQGEYNLTDEQIRRMETNTTNAERAIALKRKRQAEGVKDIRAFDCSGLVVCYLLENGYIKSDTNAAGLYGKCKVIKKSDLAAGDLVFRHNGTRVYHVGVYIGGGMVIHAKGRDVGVVEEHIDYNGENYWNQFGRFEPLQDKEGDKEMAKVIKKGMKGEDVKKLQIALNELGYGCGTADGIVGDKTIKAIQAFADKHTTQKLPECFLEAKSTLEAIQLAISLGGDTDTMADMAGAIAEAYYGDCDDLFEDTIEKSFQYPKAFVEVIKEFNEKISE